MSKDDDDTQMYVAQREWVGLTNRDITGFAHNVAKFPVFILETTKQGLCIKFADSIEWHCSDKNGDYVVINDFLMTFARAIETKLKERNNG